MNVINGVLQSLNIDETIFYQFAILLFLFFALRSVFFSRLLDVIELRRENTVRLNDRAQDKFNQAEALSEKYEGEIREANLEGQKLYSEYRKKVMEEQSFRVKEVEDKLSITLSNKEKELEKTVEGHQSRLLKNVDSLSSDLTNKFTG